MLCLCVCVWCVGLFVCVCMCHQSTTSKLLLHFLFYFTRNLCYVRVGVSSRWYHLVIQRQVTTVVHNLAYRPIFHNIHTCIHKYYKFTWWQIFTNESEAKVPLFCLFFFFLFSISFLFSFFQSIVHAQNWIIAQVQFSNKFLFWLALGAKRLWSRNFFINNRTWKLLIRPVKICCENVLDINAHTQGWRAKYGIYCYFRSHASLVVWRNQQTLRSL
jgi:hypothetical protein